METSIDDEEIDIIGDRVCEIATKLEKISSLPDGWNGPLTKATKIEAINWCWQLVAIIASSPNEISIIPTSDGTILLTWENGKTEYTAEILTGIDGNRMYLFLDHTENENYEEYDGLINETKLTKFLETNTWK